MSILHPVALEGTNPVITLADGASGALMPLPAEAIARTFQQGNDLVIVLADGNRITIADFFVLEAPSLILRDPASGDYVEVNLGKDGTIIGQQPRSLLELAEMFNASAAEIAELQVATQAAGVTASGTAWAISAAAAVGVLGVLGAAASGSDSDTDTSTGTTDTSATDAPSVPGREVTGTAGNDTASYANTAETVTTLDAEGTDTTSPPIPPVIDPNNNAGAEETEDDGDTDGNEEAEEGVDTTDDNEDADGSGSLGGTDTITPPIPPAIDPSTNAGNGEAEENGDTDGNGAAVTNINDQPSGAVALSGTATEGETLTARTNTLADDDGLGAFSYQWQRSTDSGVENIPDASQSTYTLGDADVGRTVQVEVRYTDGNGTVETLTSDASAAVTNINDQPSGAVTLSGTATEGETLTARTDTLADDDGLGAFSYQWQRSTDSGVENIPNASQSTYTLGDADVGRTVQVQVRYTDGNGTVETLTSDASAAVTNINDQTQRRGGPQRRHRRRDPERTDTLADDDGLGAFSYHGSAAPTGVENMPNASQSTYTLGR